MVTEASLIAVAIEGSERFAASVSLVLFQQEGSVLDESPANGIDQRATHENMVNALPLTLVAISSLGLTITALGGSGNILQTVLLQIVQGRVVNSIVEVAADNNFGIFWQLPDSCHEAVGNELTIGPRLLFPAVATGRVHHKNRGTISK